MGVGVGIRFSNTVYQLSFNIFILGALRKFKLNNKACTSFKIEKIKLPLTMPHPRGGKSCKMPDKCPGGWGGEHAHSWNLVNGLNPGVSVVRVV